MGKPQEVQDRFAPPKASVIGAPVGPVVMGLPDKLSKRINQHEFEYNKASENEAAASRLSERPDGRRFQAKNDQNERMAKMKESGQDEYTLLMPKKAKGAAKELLTSGANPLCIDNELEDEMESKLQLQAGKAGGKRVYAVNSVPARQHQLSSSLVPQHPSEIVPPGKQEDGDDAAGKASTLHEDDVHEARRNATQQLAAEVQRQKELQDKLLEQYPHGVPKRVLLELQEKGELVNVPTLGFGCPASTSSKVVGALLRSAS
uniref:Uncharacterized protein n=1 Tax=Chlamydomonas chlamydogama TaxID=225041 RepID=A0A7S2QUD0_9CHLO|mmetsp:Transcript_29/g.57  ORF Transcript_29/g.57 Transcript_29/m.57 type:complete len:261 (+) Transcript_29:146-928(+)|eukprot:CAMPEP_0202906044 /NCGR_PEP_ID=MMETSP1392-20130828/37139_1 /ASSEMBLY_ACC=CAM_ASM_000868 /TAXON_ID=225041 /ORGANISM="Chlamydomonas chlamydogama, Strain SAG 11-48b" /LENGTH=260 /DNA_ID=CAMNT_0049594395 /DNA_START=130 /DNA_END=912 /DNA_ORIENTATION=-